MMHGLIFAMAALGQQPAQQPPTQPDEIVVEGRRAPTKKEALRTVTDMTVTTDLQIARYHRPVCPAVVGLEPRAAAIVQKRIRETVESVGAWLDHPKCEANLILFIAGNGQGLFNELRKARPKWFSSISGPERQRLLQQRPVRAWQTVINRAPPGGIWWPSNFVNQTFANIEGSAIIIDANAIEGLTLRQVADYAAMRGLAQIRPPSNRGQLDSILSIFDRPKGAGPRELTKFDKNYLGELYTHLSRKGFDYAVHERQRIAKAIAEKH